jgi:hypothetical protein
VSGGLLYSYVAGSTTPVPTYSDIDGTMNTNPIKLDAAGRAVIYLPSGLYRFVLTDADGVAIRTYEAIPGA